MKKYVVVKVNGKYTTEQQEDRGYGNYDTREQAMETAIWLNENIETIWPYPKAKTVARVKPKTRRKQSHVKPV